MNNSSEPRKSSRRRNRRSEPPASRLGTAVLAFYSLLAVSLSLLFALAFADSAHGFWWSCVMGSFAGVSITLLIIGIISSATKLYWKYANGYPFEDGCEVVIEDKNVRARVVGASQGPLYYLVETLDTGERIWIIASKLIRCSGRGDD